MDTVIIRRK